MRISGLPASPHHHRAILGYCKEFGVALEVFTNDNRGALFHHQDHFAGQPVTARRVMTDARGYIAELLAKAVGRNALDAELTSEDKEQLLDMLRGYGGLNADDLYMGSDRGGYLGEYLHKGLGLPADVHDPLGLSALLQSGFLDYRFSFGQFLDQSPTLLQPIGGMDAIVDAFEERVGHLIQYRSRVEEIRQTPGGAQIIYSRDDQPAQALDADFCDLYYPRPSLEGYSQRLLLGHPSRDRVRAVCPGRQDCFSRPGGGSGRKIRPSMAASRGRTRTLRKSGIRPPAIIRPRESSSAPISGGVARACATRPCAPTSACRLPLPRVNTSTLAMPTRSKPGSAAPGPRCPSRRAVGRGMRNLEYSVPERLRSPEGAIYFAGDQLSGLTGWQEGAVLATYAAVEAINARVMAAGA